MREDIKVTFENNVLTIEGERKASEEVKNEQYHRIERRYGAFRRSFTLPASVDGSRVLGACAKCPVLSVPGAVAPGIG